MGKVSLFTKSTINSNNLNERKVMRDKDEGKESKSKKFWIQPLDGSVDNYRLASMKGRIPCIPCVPCDQDPCGPCQI